MAKLNKDERQVINNLKKALPKLTKEQMKNLAIGMQFLASFTEHSDNHKGGATPATT